MRETHLDLSGREAPPLGVICKGTLPEIQREVISLKYKLPCLSPNFPMRFRAGASVPLLSNSILAPYDVYALFLQEPPLQ